MSAKAKQIRESEIKCQYCGAVGNAVCRDCATNRLAMQEQEKAAIVGRGVCPQCGNSLIPNTELAGYWICGSDLSESGNSCEYEILLDI